VRVLALDHAAQGVRVNALSPGAVVTDRLLSHFATAEAALARLYPLDVDRAFRKVREIKRNTVFWSTGAESQQALRQGDAVMGLLWNTRAMLVQRDTQDRVRFTWNQGILQPSVWTVPKGNPSGKNAMRLIRAMQEPGPQVELLRLLGNGPVNPHASRAGAG
jgi:putative spermidine/putrescine transport system substrate-binding protein